jgi:hypothetical protein
LLQQLLLLLILLLQGYGVVGCFVCPPFLWAFCFCLFFVFGWFGES